MNEDTEYHWSKLPGKTYFSRRQQYPPHEEPIRYASKVMDSPEGLIEATEHDQLVLRRTPAERYEITAKFFEEGRGVFVLTIQKHNRKSGPSDKFHFSFVGSEITAFRGFLESIQNIHFPNTDKLNVTDVELRSMILDAERGKKFFSENHDLIKSLVENHELANDLIATGFRRKQLEEFRKLLFEDGHFGKRKSQLSIKSDEALWQRFFQKNTWIFGYGLSFVFLSQLEGKQLEQVVSGHSIATLGKRSDALLKSQAFVNSLCFVEIKKHTTPLVESTPYRSGSWSPSKEVSGGVTQSQVTVQETIEQYAKKNTN